MSSQRLVFCEHKSFIMHRPPPLVCTPNKKIKKEQKNPQMFKEEYTI